jgi:hypothetical protein
MWDVGCGMRMRMRMWIRIRMRMRMRMRMRIGLGMFIGFGVVITFGSACAHWRGHSGGIIHWRGYPSLRPPTAPTSILATSCAHHAPTILAIASKPLRPHIHPGY